MAEKSRKCAYHLILQDTGDPLTRTFGKMTRQQLIADSLGPIKGLPFDAYAHCVNFANGVYHNSAVRERAIASVDRYRSASTLQMKQALDDLDSQNVDVLETYCQAAHDQQQACMLRLRMQDLHDRIGLHCKVQKDFSARPRMDMPEAYYYMPQWKRDHPEYLMGDPYEETPSDRPEYFRNIAANYALQPVIDYQLDLAKELIDRYDMDVLELDFMRFAFLFHEHEAYVQRHVLTAVIREIRRYVDQSNTKRSRRLYLSARVADTVELNVRNGIDVAVWLAEGLLDAITISGGYSPFGTPWRQLAQLAEKAGVPAHACLSYGPAGQDIEVLRAATARALSQGCYGIELWNCFYAMEYYHQLAANPLPLSELAGLADRQAVMAGAKKYELKSGLDNPMVRAAHIHAAWPPQLPMTIGVGAHPGFEHLIEFDIADDPVPHKDAMWRVDVYLLDIGPQDELAFTWNGRPVDKSRHSWRDNSTHDRFYLRFDVPAGDCVKGVNVLGIALVKRDARLDPFVTLGGASLRVGALKT